MARAPKPAAVGPEDIEEAARQLTAYLQERPLATVALLGLALAIGAGANSIGRREPRERASPSAKVPEPARPGRRRRGLGVAAFELDQKAADGRRTEIDFTWTGRKPAPGAEPEPAPQGRESSIGLALFEFFHSRPGGKDTAVKFGWSKDPLEPKPGE